MRMPSTIAIDGPAASGKTTLGRQLADLLGYLYFDTGLMYRAVTLAALDRFIDVSNGEAVTSLANTLVIDVQGPISAENRGSLIYIDGEDVTSRLRTAKVDENVSAVSAYAGVRDAMTRQQRRIGERGQIVMVGRDIGTVVLPNAELKLYLDATVEERARRRLHDFQAAGLSESYESILAAMRERDRKDSTRSVAPLRAAEDAIQIDTTDIEMDDLLGVVLDLLNSRTPEGEDGV